MKTFQFLGATFLLSDTSNKTIYMSINVAADVTKRTTRQCGIEEEVNQNLELWSWLSDWCSLTEILGQVTYTNWGFIFIFKMRTLI